MAGLVSIRGRADCRVTLKPGDRTPLEFVHSDEMSSVRPETATEFLKYCCDPAVLFPSPPEVAGPRPVDVEAEWEV